MAKSPSETADAESEATDPNTEPQSPATDDGASSNKGVSSDTDQNASDAIQTGEDTTKSNDNNVGTGTTSAPLEKETIVGEERLDTQAEDDFVVVDSAQKAEAPIVQVTAEASSGKSSSAPNKTYTAPFASPTSTQRPMSSADASRGLKNSASAFSKQKAAATAAASGTATTIEATRVIQKAAQPLVNVEPAVATPSAAPAAVALAVTETSASAAADKGGTDYQKTSTVAKQGKGSGKKRKLSSSTAASKGISSSASTASTADGTGKSGTRAVPVSPHMPLADPVVGQTVHDIMALLQTYGPMSYEQLEYNLPPLTNRDSYLSRGRLVLDKSTLRDILDVLVVTGVVQITTDSKKYAMLSGVPRADVVLPTTVVADLKAALREEERTQERIKLLQKALQTPGTVAREQLKQILFRYPEVAQDPVYVAALRNLHVDVAAVERDRFKSNRAKESNSSPSKSKKKDDKSQSKPSSEESSGSGKNNKRQSKDSSEESNQVAASDADASKETSPKEATGVSTKKKEKVSTDAEAVKMDDDPAAIPQADPPADSEKPSTT